MKERFLNRIWVISLSAHILIAFENTIILSAHILIAFANALIAFENLLGLFARALILSARPLIAFTLPSDTAYSPTVPGGDPPCLTAGDARRVNPWTDDSPTLRRRRRRTAASLLHVRVTPPRFQCDAAGVGVSFVHFPHGFPLALARVSPAVTHGAPPPEAALCRCGCGGGAVGESIHTSIHTIEK